MAITLLLHVTSEDPVVVEVDELPKPTDTCIICSHPRRRDNKEVHYVLPDVTQVIFPWWRVSFIEVLPTGDEEEIYKPFRD
jgi:hypothetical protein